MALATLEVPVNQLAFRLNFGEGSFLSTFITFGIGVVLIYFAHAITPLPRIAQCSNDR